jgi:uncharacterized protein (DUF433 family)
MASEQGCYEATRAAALSGVPISTVYYWAKTGVVIPSQSPVKEKLWSYADLMALRVVSWLRRAKASGESEAVPASPMPQVRQALAFLDSQGVDLWRPRDDTQSPLVVDRAGKIWIRLSPGVITDHRGNPTLQYNEAWLDVLAPFGAAGQRGPDLRKPRPRLRIVPLKVAGEPHVAHSRITSRSLAALAGRGFDTGRLAEMYGLERQDVKEALDLESQLAANLGLAA